MTDLALVLLHVDLVTQYDKREVFGVMRACLDEELVPPAVEGLEALGTVDVVDEYAAVGTAIKGNAK